MNFNLHHIPKELIPTDPRFGVGPSLIPLSFLDQLTKTKMSLLGTSHRQKNVVNLIRSIQDGFKSYFNLPDDYLVIIGNGGASFLFDLIGLGLVKSKSSHFCCGEFSKKWYHAHANIPWISTDLNEVPCGEGINPDLREGSSMICSTLNETSTGVMINHLPDLRDTDVLQAVDATSGGGQIFLDFKKVDVYFLSPQKVFASEGGTFVMILSPKAIERAIQISQLKNRYIPKIMNLVEMINLASKSQTLNTPCISSLFFLNEQIQLMNNLGEEKVIKLAKDKAMFIYDWALNHKYLELFVKDEDFRSHSVAVIDIIKKDFDIDVMFNFLREHHIAYDINGYRKISDSQLRISLFHNIELDNLIKLTKILDIFLLK